MSSNDQSTNASPPVPPARAGQDSRPPYVDEAASENLGFGGAPTEALVDPLLSYRSGLSRRQK